jgi:hypothetical protein
MRAFLFVTNQRADLIRQGYATIIESLALLSWLKAHGYVRLGMCGTSLGGVHRCKRTLLPFIVCCRFRTTAELPRTWHA